MIFPSISELFKAVNLYLDKFQAPNFIEEEFVIFYNNVVQKFIIFQIPLFEKRQDIVDDFRNLSKKTVPALLPNLLTGYFTIPSDYLYLLAVQFKVQYKDCNGNTKSVYKPSKASKLDSLYSITQSEFRKPAYDMLYHEQRENLIIPYCDVIDGNPVSFSPNVSLTECTLNYIRQPIAIGWSGTVFTGSLEFPDSTMEKIFTLCTVEMLENIESIRTGTFFKLNQNI